MNLQRNYNMEIKQELSLDLEFTISERQYSFMKDDLIGYRGDIYRVREVKMTPLKIYVHCELSIKGGNMYTIQTENAWCKNSINCVYNHEIQM